MSLLLVADVGNTQMVFGLYRRQQLVGSWRISSRSNLTSDELAWQLHGMFTQLGLSPETVFGIMAASVVPHLDAPLTLACERICGSRPLFVGTPQVRTGMAVDYKNPREVGADRVVNAIAARKMFGSPVIVVDCGTATTFDIVSPQGHYAGGLILPGIEIALKALSERTAKLPEVSLVRTEMLIGRDTVTSMQAGSYWSAVDGLSGLIRRLLTQPGYEHAPVVATGGLAHLLLGDIPEIHHHVEHLTLEGLRMLGESHFRS